jgi:hypothetical protein
VPTAVESDRSTKLDLVESLDRSPEILILGSSRARQAEPAYLEGLTGRSGFNAGVTGGTAADAWVFTRFAAERFPRVKRRYVWFVDVGIAGSGVNPQLAADPRGARYLEGGRLRFGLKDVGTYLSFDATRASVRVLRSCVLRSCASPVTYLPDGSIPRPRLRFLPEHGENVAAAAAALAASVRTKPAADVTNDPTRYRYFEMALEFMNARGERPVIVLNPVYPTVLAALEQRGYPGRAASLAYLRGLRRRGFEFVLVDCQDIRAWGGKVEDFSNPTHVNRRNMRRMLEHVVAHADGELE